MRWRLDELLSWQSCDSMEVEQTNHWNKLLDFRTFEHSDKVVLSSSQARRAAAAECLEDYGFQLQELRLAHSISRSMKCNEVYVRCCPNFLELRYTRRKLVLGNWSPMRCVQLGYRLVSIWRPQSHSCVLCGGDGYGCVKMMCAVYANSIRSKDWAGMKGAQVHSAWCVQIAKPKSDLKFVRSHGPVKHLHPSWSWWRMWWVTRLQIVGRLISLFASNSVRARAEDCSQGLADHLYTRCKEYNKIYIVSWHIFAWELMGLRHLKWAAPFFLGRNQWNKFCQVNFAVLGFTFLGTLGRSRFQSMSKNESWIKRVRMPWCLFNGCVWDAYCVESALFDLRTLRCLLGLIGILIGILRPLHRGGKPLSRTKSDASHMCWFGCQVASVNPAKKSARRGFKVLWRNGSSLIWIIKRYVYIYIYMNWNASAFWVLPFFRWIPSHKLPMQHDPVALTWWKPQRRRRTKFPKASKGAMGIDHFSRQQGMKV